MNQLIQWITDFIRSFRIWTVVLPWERGLRVRLGRWTQLWEPGLHWQIPLVDEVRVINTRIRVASVPCATVTTRDGKTVTVAGSVAFRIADPYRALLAVQQPEDAAAALAQAAVANYVLSHNAGALDVGALESEVVDALRAAPLEGMEFEFFKTVDFAIVRTLRLLQEQWRPNTGHSFTDHSGQPPIAHGIGAATRISPSFIGAARSWSWSGRRTGDGSQGSASPTTRRP